MVATSRDFPQDEAGGALELCDGELLVRIDQIQKVVRDLGSLGLARLRRPDIHAPVDAHGVHRHDLNVATAARQIEGRCRLP
jgi:hypothetical protein